MERLGISSAAVRKTKKLLSGTRLEPLRAGAGPELWNSPLHPSRLSVKQNFIEKVKETHKMILNQKHLSYSQSPDKS